MTKNYALQDLAAPDGVCFGCGAKNPHGLQKTNAYGCATHAQGSRRWGGWT